MSTEVQEAPKRDWYRLLSLMRTTFLTLVTVGLVVYIVASMTRAVSFSYKAGKAIDSWGTLAASTDDAQTADTYIQNELAAMRTYGATSGSWGHIFQTPTNDFGIIYRNLVVVDQRLKLVGQKDPASADYATSLVNVQNTLDRFGGIGLHLAWFKYWFNFTWGVVGFILFTIACFLLVPAPTRSRSFYGY